MRPSAINKRKDLTDEAIGARLACQPCTLALSEPPTEKELSDCIIATERPCSLRKGMTSSHKAPACTVSTRPSALNLIALKGSISITMPSAAMVWPPMECLAPAMDTESCSRWALASNSINCCSAACGAAGICHTSCTRALLRRLASSTCSVATAVIEFWSCTAVATKCSAGTPTAMKMATTIESFNKRLKRTIFFMIYSQPSFFQQLNTLVNHLQDLSCNTNGLTNLAPKNSL